MAEQRSREPGWTLSDLLDLEYLLERRYGGSGTNDDGGSERAFFLRISKQCPATPGRQRDSCLLFHWLQEYRRGPGMGPFPGTLFSQIVVTGYWLVITAFFLLGFSSSFSFLHYTGTMPVNVGVFFLLFVVSQVAVLFLLFLALLFGRFVRKRQPLAQQLLRQVLFQLFFRVRRHLSVAPAAQWLLSVAANRGGGHGSIASLLSGSFFGLSQVAGVSFNTGVLAALLLKVTTADMAFGWQSSLRVGPHTVHALVRIVAWPWSWLLPEGVGYPAFEQIEGSQLVLKQGISHLANADLLSWWPFLFLSLCCYGLLPRLFILGAILMRQHRLLRKYPFDLPLQRQLLHKMATPALRTTTPARKQERRSGAMEAVSREPDSAMDAPAGRILAVIPDELEGQYEQQRLTGLIEARFGLVADRFASVDMGPASVSAILERTGNGTGEEQRHLLLLQEAWQPPIGEFVHLVRELRRGLSDNTLLIVALIGRPRVDDREILTPVHKEELLVWQQRLAGLGDPYLQCEPLVGIRK